MLKCELILCIGAPGSGKSTWSKQFVKENKEYVRVNRDDLRLMFQDSQMLSGELESSLSQIVQEMVTNLLYLGHSMVLDQTNCRYRYIEQWVSLNIPIKLKFFNEPLEILLERNSKRTTDKVPEEVVTFMYNNLQEMINNKLLDNYVEV